MEQRLSLSGSDANEPSDFTEKFDNAPPNQRRSRYESASQAGLEGLKPSDNSGNLRI